MENSDLVKLKQASLLCFAQGIHLYPYNRSISGRIKLTTATPDRLFSGSDNGQYFLDGSPT